MTEKKLKLSIETISAIITIAFTSIFILANFVIGFVWPIFVLATIISLLISIRYPRSGLYAGIFLVMIFESFFTIAPLVIGRMGYRIYPLDILMIGIILGIIVQGQFRFKKNRTDWILIGFIILNIIYFFASIFFLQADFSLAVSSLKSVVFYGLLYFIASFLIRTEEDLKRMTKFFIAGGIGIVGFIIAGLVLGKGIWSEVTPGLRLLAFTHGLFATFTLIALCMKLIFEKNRFLQLNWKIILIIIWVVGIIGTMMRHLWLSIIASFIIIFFFLAKEKKKQLIKIGASIAVFFSLVILMFFYVSWMFPNSKIDKMVNKSLSVIVSRGGSLSTLEEDESASWRIMVWKSAYKEYGNNLILGSGTGQKIFVEKKDYQAYVNVRDMHNSYLVILVQLGIFGLGILLYLFFEVIKKIIKLDNQSVSRNVYKFSLLGCLALFIIASLFQPYLETNTLNIFFWTMLGLARILPEINFKNNSIN